MPVVVFCMFFYIAGNQYQTESKCNETSRRIFMDQKTNSGTKKHLGGAPRGAQPTRAHQEAQACPGGLCPPRVPPRTTSLLYKYPKNTRTLWESTKYSSTCRRVKNHQIQSRHRHGGVHHFHWCLSNDVCVVLCRPMCL